MKKMIIFLILIFVSSLTIIETKAFQEHYGAAGYTYASYLQDEYIPAISSQGRRYRMAFEIDNGLASYNLADVFDSQSLFYFESIIYSFWYESFDAYITLHYPNEQNYHLQHATSIIFTKYNEFTVYDYLGYAIDIFNWSGQDIFITFVMVGASADNYEAGYYDGYNTGYGEAKAIYQVYGYNTGYREAKEFYGILHNNEWINAESYGNIRYNEGQNDNFNFLEIFLNVIFSAISAFGNLEILPNFKIAYVVGIIVVFGLIFFIIGKRKD